MPARDRYHVDAKRALVQDGWTITLDPLQRRWGKMWILEPSDSLERKKGAKDRG